MYQAAIDNPDKKFKVAYTNVGNQVSLNGYSGNQMIDMFINPLLMAWEKYHYGSHDNFWQEGDSMFGYMMFEINAKEIITDLIKALQTESPFAQFERDSRITNGLLKVYNHLNRQL